MAEVGDPGGEHAVRVVDEVVAGERVDDVALAAPVRGGDRHELAVARRRRERVRAGEQPPGVGREQRGGDEDLRRGRQGHGRDAPDPR